MMSIYDVYVWHSCFGTVYWNEFSVYDPRWYWRLLSSHEKGLDTLHPNGDRSLGCCFLIVIVHLNRDKNIKFDVLLYYLHSRVNDETSTTDYYLTSCIQQVKEKKLLYKDSWSEYLWWIYKYCCSMDFCSHCLE